MLLLKNFSLDRSEFGEKLKLPANVFFAFSFVLLFRRAATIKVSLLWITKRKSRELIEDFHYLWVLQSGQSVVLRTEWIFHINYSFGVHLYLSAGGFSSECLNRMLNYSNLIVGNLIIELQVDSLDSNTRYTTHYRVGMQFEKL